MAQRQNKRVLKAIAKRNRTGKAYVYGFGERWIAAKMPRYGFRKIRWENKEQMDIFRDTEPT